jgi:hypothetical protein
MVKKSHKEGKHVTTFTSEINTTIKSFQSILILKWTATGILNKLYHNGQNGILDKLSSNMVDY